MAEYDDIDNDFDVEDDNDFGYGDQSSSLVKKLRRELNATKKALKEKDSELSGLMSETRSRTVKEILQSRGANPKIATFIPKDISPNEDDINSWLDEYGDVFGFVPESTQPAVSVDSGALGRMSAAEERGVSVESSTDLM